MGGKKTKRTKSKGETSPGSSIKTSVMSLTGQSVQLMHFNSLKPNCQTPNCQLVIISFMAKLSYGQFAAKMLAAKTLTAKAPKILAHSFTNHVCAVKLQNCITSTWPLFLKAQLTPRCLFETSIKCLTRNVHQPAPNQTPGLSGSILLFFSPSPRE